MKNKHATYTKKWGYYITVYDGKWRGGKHLIKLRWEGLTFEILCKYKWYFEYRYALLRIKYPKNEIQHNSFSYELSPNEKYELWKNAVKGKKATITKFKNLLKKAEQTWNFLFPIEDDFQYKKAVIKIERLENELKQLELLYDTTTDD